MYRLFLSLILFLFFIGCSDKSLTPEQTTELFWKAYQENRIADAEKLTVREKINVDEFPRKLKIEKFEFTKATVSGGRATIPTVIVFKDGTEKNSSEIKISFDTKLLKIDKEWRIDFADTSKLFYAAIAKQFANELSDTFSSFVEEGAKMLKNFEQTLKEGAQELEKNLGDALKDMEKELEKQQKKLEKEENPSVEKLRL